MSIFDLHSQVLADYRDFVRSFFTIADDRTREFVDRALDEEAQALARPALAGQPFLRPLGHGGRTGGWRLDPPGNRADLSHA